MARIRTIKPEFPQSESMGRVSRDARLCFIELWTIADDSGRLRGASRMLASLLFPYDNDAPELIDSWLAELHNEGCIIQYEAEGQHYIQIVNWYQHQKIDKPSKSFIPPFVESSRILANPRESSEKALEHSSGDLGPRTKDLGMDQGEEPKKNLVLGMWYKKHQEKTARMVSPSDTDRIAAKDLIDRYPQDELERAVKEYWDNWPDHWFSVKNGDSKKPREERKPMFVFSSFAAHIEELLQDEVPRETQPNPERQKKNLVECPVCGTMGDPNGRSQCKICHYMLLPGIIDDMEQVASFKAEWEAERENA